MNIFERLGQQPRHWLMAQAVVFLAVVAAINALPAWRGTMLIFYCLPVYIVAVYFPRRVAIGFTLVAAIVAMIARVDSIHTYGLGRYFWTAFNRTGGLFFAAGCGIAFRQYRQEAERRFKAFKHSQALELEVVRAAELERQKIGHDLHDSLCQTLAALDCAAQCLRIDLEADGSPRTDAATQLQKHLSNATLEARNMARGIYPVSLSAETLPLALQELATTMSHLFGGSIEVSSDHDIPVTDSKIPQHVYRIAQEALSNALRHANATRIEIALRQQARQLVLTVTDDGCGSAFQQRPEGMGWHTMRYRANLIAAHLAVKSEPGQGTVLVCEVPIDHLAPDHRGDAVDAPAAPLSTISNPQ
ncbi:MAG TPA: sensor histidine kinase [Chthoniobacter sp.]|jgi:signal transduction histidine kinase